MPAPVSREWLAIGKKCGHQGGAGGMAKTLALEQQSAGTRMHRQSREVATRDCDPAVVCRAKALEEAGCLRNCGGTRWLGPGKPCQIGFTAGQ